MWKKYKNFNIEANEKGQIRNSKTKRIRKPTVLSKGYQVITLYEKGKRKNVYIHRIIAELFLQNHNNYSCVNHIDNNKINNNVNNLEWCTQKHNIQMAFYEQNAFAKYTCKCCGKEFFQMGRRKANFAYCHSCKTKLEILEKEKQKNIKLKKEREEFIRNVKNCGSEVNFYYVKHQEVFDKWANGKSTYKLSKELNCSHQNISQIISNLKGLFNSYNLQPI
jgi:hypothetical protein